MNRRVAILVLAHLPAPLQCLLDVLDDRFAVFVHLDAKTDAKPADLRLPPHATALEPRRAVHWGGWSMMQATLNLMQAAREHDVLALVSGDSLPLLPADELLATLTDGGADRIEMLEVADDPTLAGQPREASFARHGWEQPWRFHNFVHWDDRLLNPFGAADTVRHYGLRPDRADWLRGDTQRLVAEVLAGLPPRPRLFPRLLYGAQWWALSGQTVATLLPALHRPEVQDYFRFFPVPDEHMIHTVLGTLPAPPTRGTPMHTMPAGTALDGPALRQARAGNPDLLFARKFNPAMSADIAAAIADGRFDALLQG